MNKTFAPKRLISAVLAFTLTSTLIPSASLAFAADAINTEPIEEAQDQAVAPEPTSTEEAVADEAPAITSAELPVSAGAADEAATTDATSDVEIVSASVRLGDEQTIISYNDMSFALNDDGETVSLIGVAASAEGTLEIPQTIAVASKTYALTRIMSGGGSLI